MAYQHLYARVPASASMFRKCDGFDTFACSAGLDEDFLRREILLVCENKLGKTDIPLVREGKMPPVYSQCKLRSGKLVQSCVSYLPKDYTGERSAYLCHSLILDEDETKCLLHTHDKAIVYPNLFVQDITSFQITSSNNLPNDAYPCAQYTLSEAEDPMSVLARFQSDTIKSFIYAVLLSLCGKGKNVFFRLDCNDSELSMEALRFIQAIMSIVPFHLRAELSFVTQVNDISQYNYCKLRCVSEKCGDVPSSKGVYFDFHTDHVQGIRHDEVISNKFLIQFFYFMLEKKQIRQKFLEFIDYAVTQIPALESMNLKTLNDLVFLFSCCCGLFPEHTVLPVDAKVFELLCVYEKYRNVVCDAYRCNVYCCLSRYVQRHEPIPKNIFGKMTRLYPGESNDAQKVVMDIVLELIHTDIMREKLFIFLRNHYDAQTQTIRRQINEDLCRVFYGGFLQQQILAFFADHFAQEPMHTRALILEKVLLSIRTAAIQPKILEFLQRHYFVFDGSEKQQVLTMVRQMLPECDSLSEAVVKMVNCVATDETAEMKAQFELILTGLLESESRKKEQKLLPLLCAESGFCRDCVQKLAFGVWSGRKLLDVYLINLSGKTVLDKTEALVRATQIVPEISHATRDKLVQSLDTIYSEHVRKADLYAWMQAEEVSHVSVNENWELVLQYLRGHIFYSAIVQSFSDVFLLKLKRDGMETVERFVARYPIYIHSTQYQMLKSFQRLQKSVNDCNSQDVFACLDVMARDRQIHKSMAGYFRACMPDSETLTSEHILLYDMCILYLENESLLSAELYSEYKMCIPSLRKGSARQSAQYVAEGILRYLIEACQADIFLEKVICSDTAAISSFLSSFCADYGRGSEKWITKRLEEAPTALKSAFRKALADRKPPKKGLLALLLGK